jgi:V/A-type H+-transporting ATPase subunit I
MARVRILGPRERLEAVLGELQDLEILQLASPVSLPVSTDEATAGTAAADGDAATGDASTPDARAAAGSDTGSQEGADTERRAATTRRRIEAIGWLLEHLPAPESSGRGTPAGLPDEAMDLDGLLTRLHGVVAAIGEELGALGRERARLRRVRELLGTFRGLEALRGGSGATHPYFLLLETRDGHAVQALREGLARLLGDGFELLEGPASDGETPAVLLVPGERTEEVERLLSGAGIQELPLAAGGGEAGRSSEERLAAIDARLAALGHRLGRLARRYRSALEERLRTEHDRLLALEARASAATSRHAFILQGFVPEDAVRRLETRLRDRVGPTVVVERQGREAWEGDPAPVVLHNPRLFRPFEAITRTLPLPRYGSIDPTPFVAVFFPMFFGVIVGDVAYGLVIAALALFLRRGSEPDGLRRSIAEIAGACAAFTIVFGFLYGEFAGDLGRRLFGLRPLLLDREEALVPFLALAIALGFVQVVLGLVLGAIASFRGHRRESLGRGLSAVMLVLVALALLAAVEILPHGFFTPAIVALLVAFPVLVVLEGFLAPIELLSTLGNVLSYARIMAVGTASVMMAVVANRLAGAVGGVLVGILFGLLFHLVNFGLALFGPTIHGLRLHYVEFFGKFFSPGGIEYRPFGHWRPEPGPPSNPSAADAARSV